MLRQTVRVDPRTLRHAQTEGLPPTAPSSARDPGLRGSSWRPDPRSALLALACPCVVLASLADEGSPPPRLLSRCGPGLYTISPANFSELRHHEVRRIPLPRTLVNKVPSGSFQRSLSLLVSNLSSTSSKAPVPMRAPPEKGCSMAPTVNKTSPITAARIITISLCAQVLSRPKRYVKLTTAIPPKTRTAHSTPGTPSSAATRRILLASASLWT